MLNGTTYIVRPLHRAGVELVISSRIAPDRASCCWDQRWRHRVEQMNVRSSTRATSAGSLCAQ
jgi:hypothetical protein